MINELGPRHRLPHSAMYQIRKSSSHDEVNRMQNHAESLSGDFDDITAKYYKLAGISVNDQVVDKIKEMQDLLRKLFEAFPLAIEAIEHY